MNKFTEVYSLKNNYIWNYHMPLLLPDLLHYLNNKDQLQDYQYKSITTIIHKSIRYYGFTPLTMTNLTPAQRLQINNYLIDYKLSLATPEIDYDRLRGSPDYNTYFTIYYFSSIGSRLKAVHDYRLQNWQRYA